ncbi:hypothetical protein G9A89_008025 [Geosiphon pyriformis]|nr:hypothetical protein G9A89_008025 [Geosiphon pyriformis]
MSVAQKPSNFISGDSYNTWIQLDLQKKLFYPQSFLYVISENLKVNSFKKIHEYVYPCFTIDRKRGKRLKIRSVLFLIGQAKQLSKPFEAHPGEIIAVRCSPMGNVAVSASMDATIKIWDAQTGEFQRQIDTAHELGVVCVDVHPTGSVIATTSVETEIKIWDADDCTELIKIPAKTLQAWHGQFSPDGRFYASGSFDGKINLWSTEKYLDVPIKFDTGTRKFCHCVRFSPDGKVVAVGIETGRIYVFDTQSGKQIHALSEYPKPNTMFLTSIRGIIKGHGKLVRSIDFTNDSKLLISGSDDRMINVYDIKHGNRIANMPGQDGWVLTVSAAGSQSTLFAAGTTEGTIKLWDIASRKCVWSYVNAHHDSVWEISWNPESDSFVSGSDDMCLKWWSRSSENRFYCVPTISLLPGRVRALLYSFSVYNASEAIYQKAGLDVILYSYAHYISVDHIWPMLAYNKSKPFFDYEATVGSVIAVIKKATKVSGSEGGFKMVASRKKRKGGVLAESVNNSEVADKALGNHLWGSKVGDTTESESIDMEEECLVEKTSVDYDDDVLDGSFYLPPPLPIKPSVQVPVCKSFALDIDLVAVVEKSSQEKLNFAMMAAAQLANDYGVVVNTDLKCPINNHMNQAIVLKEISVETSIKAVHTAISEFGLIKSIKMQLVGLWQKAIVELEDQIQADLLKDAVCMARADVDKQTWNARDEFRALLYTLSMSITAHDLWDFIGSVSGKTCVIERSSISYVQTHCATAMANTPVIKGISLHWSRLTAALCSIRRNSGHTFFTCHTAGVFSSSKSKRAPLSAQNQLRLAKIYEKKSAPVSHPLAFVLFSGSAQFGSISYGKPLLTVSGKLEDHLKNIENSLVSLMEQIGELAKRLNLFVLAVSQPSSGCQLPVTPLSLNQGEDIVMGVSLDVVTSDKTAAVTGCEIGKHVRRSLCFGHEPIGALGWFGFGRWCSSSTSFSMSDLVWKIAMCNVCGLNNSAKQDDVIRWHKNMGNLVSIFTESKLKGKHVYKISEVSGQLLSIKLLFKNKLSVSILGIYAGVSAINSLIAKAVNKSSFVILGGDFNEDGLHRSASFKKCSDLGLVNSLGGSSFVKTLTWCNSHGITKTIDYMFVSSNLVGVVVDCGVDGVEKYFNTDHKAVYVFVRLGGLLDSEFKNATAANVVMFLDEFDVAKQFSDLDAMWDIVCKVVVLSAGGTFKKKWFKGYDSVFNKVSSRFHRLELLVSKLVRNFCLVSGGDFAFLLETWDKLDSSGVSEVKSLFLSGSGFDRIHSILAKARKLYCTSKLLESKRAEESSIKQAIGKRMESFELDKDHTIRSVLECPFCKVVLDHLVVGDKLVLEPESVKLKVNEIMEGWTRKCWVIDDISDDWCLQYWPLEYVFDGAFSGVMCSIEYDEFLEVVSDLSDGKVAGLSGISNELWKHCNRSVLDLLLVLLNFCLSSESVSSPWKEAWVSMIPKPYEWEGVLMNTRPIALIKTARKILFKILSDRISLACSTFDVLRRNNFSVLKGTSTQFPIFAVGSVVEDALEKNREL